MSSMGTTWGFVKNANSQPSPQTGSIRNSVGGASPPGNSKTLRITVLIRQRPNYKPFSQNLVEMQPHKNIFKKLKVEATEKY